MTTFQDWQLVLGTHLGRPGFVLLCAAAAAAALLSALGMVRARVRRGGPVLLALRLLALLACLTVALEPTLELREITRIRNHIAILVDTSRSMSVSPPSGGASRLERASASLRAEAGRIAAWRAEGHGVDFYALGEALTATDGDFSGPPAAEATRIGEALTELRGRYAGRDLGAVILYSDGIDNGRIGAGPLDPETREALAALGAPVHTVAIGESSLNDLAIAQVLADDFAFVRTPIKLEAIVRHSGLGGRLVEVSLLRDGQLMDVRTVRLEGAASETKVSFPFTPQQPGSSVFEIRTPVLAGEALATNNSHAFSLKIIRDRVRILHVSGRPSWDVRFLRAMLRLDPNVDLVSFFILRTREDDSPWDQRRELSLIPFPHREIFDEQLHSFDLLIFHNFNYQPYEVGAFLPGVRDYVLGGGALAMIGGDLSFAAGAYGASPLAAVLPVELDGIPTAREGAYQPGRYRPRLTAEGQSHPVTALALDARANERRWDGLPPIEGLNRAARVRAGATVLMTHPREKTSDGQPAPVLAVADMGKGRTLGLLTDSAWHWGFLAAGAGDDGRAFQRFWDNAIRWLVRDPALTLLRVELDRTDTRRGQAVPVRLRSLHADYTPAGDVEIALEVIAVGAEAPARELRAVTGAQGEATIELADLPPGAYRLRARATIDGRAIEESRTLVVRPEGRELEDVIARPDWLAALSEASGGEAYRDELGRAPIKPMRQERLGRRRAIELGAHPGLMVLALALLCAEWYLRRRWGYR